MLHLLNMSKLYFFSSFHSFSGSHHIQRPPQWLSNTRYLVIKLLFLLNKLFPKFYLEKTVHKNNVSAKCHELLTGSWFCRSVAVTVATSQTLQSPAARVVAHWESSRVLEIHASHGADATSWCCAASAASWGSPRHGAWTPHKEKLCHWKDERGQLQLPLCVSRVLGTFNVSCSIGVNVVTSAPGVCWGI